MKKINSNAFENVHFGDEKYGLLGSFPAKISHVSGTGLLKHMFGCLDSLIGGKESFGALHHCLVRDAEQQSEKGFPCMSIRIGICVVLKESVTALCYFCVMHTHSGEKLMLKEMKERIISLNQNLPETVLIV